MNYRQNVPDPRDPPSWGSGKGERRNIIPWKTLWGKSLTLSGQRKQSEIPAGDFELPKRQRTTVWAGKGEKKAFPYFPQKKPQGSCTAARGRKFKKEKKPWTVFTNAVQGSVQQRIPVWGQYLRKTGGGGVIGTDVKMGTPR